MMDKRDAEEIAEQFRRSYLDFSRLEERLKVRVRADAEKMNRLRRRKDAIDVEGREVWGEIGEGRD